MSIRRSRRDNEEIGGIGQSPQIEDYDVARFEIIHRFHRSPEGIGKPMHPFTISRLDLLVPRSVESE